MNKICYIMPHAISPRMRKRIRLVLNEAITLIISTKRYGYNLDNGDIEGLNSIVIDVNFSPSTKLFRRLLEIIKFNILIWKEICTFSPDILYVSGYDSLVAAVLYKTKKRNIKIIAEFGDIRSVFISQKKHIKDVLLSQILNLYEKKVFRSVDKIVLTSEKFYSEHFDQFFKKEDVYIIPNIPDKHLFDGYIKKSSGTFTVGFIGEIRYIPQLTMLIEASRGLCNLFIAGGGNISNVNKIKDSCKDREDIELYGKYIYEKDIANLYGHVDCMYAVYDSSNENCKIALPNKLYESIICEIPIIVADNTYLGELVRKWGVGVTVQSDKKEDLMAIIHRLSEDAVFYNEIVMCCKNKKKDFEAEKYMKKLKKYMIKETGYEN